MRYSFITFFFISITVSLYGQDKTIANKGQVSYVASENVYVRFESTENITIGDTLFIIQGDKRLPFLVVINKSSISCVCIRITSYEVNISDEIIAQKVIIKEPVKVIAKKLLDQQEGKSSSFRTDESILSTKFSRYKPLEKRDSTLSKEINNELFKQKIKGRVSVTSYNSLSSLRTNHRMRYTFSLRGDHLGDSRFSIESYINYRNTLNERKEIKKSLSNALKVYSLALKYDFSKNSSLTVGRKINPDISSMGAIDGVQFVKRQGNFLLGLIIGSRPDYLDYGLNLNLFQYGAYVNHISENKKKYHRSTLAFIEQRNNSKIDRRFVYFQHTSSLAKNLNLFSSFEMALYENINNEAKNVLSLTSLYLSLRYRFSKKLNVSASYDARKNIIYYESFKSFIDKLIEDETRQGFRFHINYRPFKNVTWGINTGWRLQKSNKNLSKNLNSYLTFSRIPSLNIRTTITANFLRTSYLDGRIFGIRISKEIIRGKLYGDINFRMVDYKYLNSEFETHQNIAGVTGSLKIIKKLTLYLYYEGTFDEQNRTYNRLNAKLIKRF